MKYQRKNSAGAVLINKEFMNMPEIVQMFCDNGGKYLNILIYISYRLSMFKNAIGLKKDLRGFANYLQRYESNLKKIMLETHYFVIDEVHGIFYSPRQRIYCGLEAHPSEEEIRDVLENGNIFYGRKKSARNAAENTAKKEGRMTEEIIKKKMLKSEPSDIQTKDDCLSISKSKNITNSISNITTKDNACSNTAACSDEVDDVKEFKEILSSPSWCRSVHKRLGVNLEDTATLETFAQWMHSYCTSQQKRMKNSTEVRRYATNLLRQDTRTRSEYERYVSNGNTGCTTAASKNDVEIEAEPADYECVVDGMRYSCNGQLLPPDAPKQPSPNMMYSYLNNTWVYGKDYDRASESASCRTRRISESWYRADNISTTMAQKGGML